MSSSRVVVRNVGSQRHGDHTFCYRDWPSSAIGDIPASVLATRRRLHLDAAGDVLWARIRVFGGETTAKSGGLTGILGR
jgi:hypothetical protein